MHSRDIRVDRSIMPILAARIGDRAARNMMEDLAATKNGKGDIFGRLATVLGSPTVPACREINPWTDVLHYSAMISGTAHWTGRRLSLDHPIPETVVQAIVGMPLSAVVAHPLLPQDRIITGATTHAGRTYIDVETDEASAHALSGPRSFLAEPQRRWRCFDRRARHAMYRGIPIEAALMPLLFLLSLVIFIISAANSGAPDGAPAVIVAVFGFVALGTGWMSRHLLERLMDEAAETTVLRSYHAVRTIRTREDIEQGLTPDPRTHAIL